MRLIYLYSLLLLCLHITANSQTTTITIGSGPDWTDATLIKSLKPSESGMANTNYNSYPRVASTTWTHSGSQITYRTLLRFDLSNIPMAPPCKARYFSENYKREHHQSGAGHGEEPFGQMQGEGSKCRRILYSLTCRITRQTPEKCFAFFATQIL
jgi:hypothetical protein